LQQEVQRYTDVNIKLKEEQQKNIEETTKLKQTMQELHKKYNNFTEEEIKEHIEQSDITLKDKLIDIYIKINGKVKDKLNIVKLKRLLIN